jgi:molecular chaperone GrpE (heat shock protein)
VRWPFGREDDRHVVLLKELTELRREVQELGTELNTAVAKLQRFQFNAQRDTQEAMRQLGEQVSELGTKMAELQPDSRYPVEHLRVRLLDMLDQLDIVLQGREAGMDESWRQLIEEWQRLLLNALDGVGLSEVEVLGRRFDPKTAEAIGVVDWESSWAAQFPHPEPYLVVRVVRRGFLDAAGGVYRKARVVTLEANAQEIPAP